MTGTARAEARRLVVAEMIRSEPGVLHVRGDCMAPVLQNGDEVRLIRKNPWPGDIVAICRRDGEILVHRFLMKRPWFDPARRTWVLLAVARPDQGTKFDSEVPAENLLGVVCEIGNGKEQPSRVLTIGVLDRARAMGWVARYLVGRVVSCVRRRVAGLEGRQS